MKPGAIDQLLSIAAGQDALVSVEQAGTVGISPSMLLKAAERGWLDRERKGVYVVAGAGPSEWRPARAAALVAGLTRSSRTRPRPRCTSFTASSATGSS